MPPNIHRRDLLKVLTAAAALPFVPRSAEAALRFGRQVHERMNTRDAAGAAGTLTAAQLALVATLSEMIIPETDTPGAISVKVPEFIDFLLTEWFPDLERIKWLAGLDAIDTECRLDYGHEFVALAEPQKLLVLRALDGMRKARDGAGWTFGSIKRLTVYGYFTSERVQREIIKTPIIPGRFDGCAPVSS